MEKVNLIMPKVVDEEIPGNKEGLEEDKMKGTDYVTVNVIGEKERKKDAGRDEK